MKKILSVILIISFAFSLVSCEKAEKKYTDYSFDSFDTVTTITGYEKSKEDFDIVCSEIKYLLGEYHRLYDIYNEYEGINNLFSINSVESGVHKAVKVDDEIIDLLKFSKDMYDLSDGKVNIAMGSVLSLWHTYREQGIDNPQKASVPPENLLKEASKHTDINDVIIDESAGTVFLSDPLMSLDVGAVAKGYALEKTAAYLEEKGVTGYLINVGGNVRAIGKKADNKPWSAGVENPDRENTAKPYIAQVSLTDDAIATSGSYQRYYTVDGKNYHHIIDRSTLMPGENFLSVSVVCDDSGLADGLSTALFLMTYEDGEKLSEKIGLDEVIWAFPDGSIKKKQYGKKADNSNA